MTHVPALESHEWNDSIFCTVENPNGDGHLIYLHQKDPCACGYCGKMAVLPGAIVAHFKICPILKHRKVHKFRTSPILNFSFSENATSTPFVFRFVFYFWQSRSRPKKALKITKLNKPVQSHHDDDEEDDKEERGRGR